MATVGEAIAATLIAQWTAAGGAQPDPIQYLVERPERDPNPTVADAVYVWLPLRRKFDPVDVAETYRNVTYTIRVVCHTKTSSARQKEIENEVDRILNSGTPITGATRQRVKEINDISNRSYSVLPKYISEVIVEVFTAMEVSATAYGTGTTSTFETDELTVNTSIVGNPTAALGATTINDAVRIESGVAEPQLFQMDDGVTEWQLIADNAPNFWGFYDGTRYRITIHEAGTIDFDDATEGTDLAEIMDALMLGSANAAWVPTAPMVSASTANETFKEDGYISNVGANDMWCGYILTMPTTKGSLKLYVTGFRAIVYDADATNKITSIEINGVTETAVTNILIDGTDRTAQGDYESALANTDCSGYDYISCMIVTTVADANALDFGPPLLECYYA